MNITAVLLATLIATALSQSMGSSGSYVTYQPINTEPSIPNKHPNAQPNNYNQPNTNQPNHGFSQTQINQIKQVMLVGAIIGLAIVFSISGAMIFMCLRRRSQRNRVRQAMQMKKHQFAMQTGLSVFELDANLMGRTIHI